MIEIFSFEFEGKNISIELEMTGFQNNDYDTRVDKSRV